ncbi:NnrS family protein [Sphingomonas rhizophila]|uniref:NnrS family protein n=1 Tax=Sphingomonas rhizophila TaxID=2071607 RepID=A0A7G9S9X5_9SPHN|nr:NnrS family protein [Sphingomonas rhizophila]QNN64650.1 NnrS family protein [Sphingomonas rhizophila]
MTVTTRGEQMLALRRTRMEAAPAFLRGGFRPFFFLGAAWAVTVVTLWVMAMGGRSPSQAPSTPCHGTVTKCFSVTWER